MDSHHKRCSDENLLYDGAGEVVQREFAHIQEWRGLSGDPQVGLALSGGGIRSASFCLGVLQALAHTRALPSFDYLSTVSGGGYIGASLTYLLHQSAHDPERGLAGQLPRFDTSPEHFPYVSYPMVSVEAPHPGLEVVARMKGRLLRRLRQNVSYLAPSKRITLLSLAGVLVRNLMASVVVHVAVLVLAFEALLAMGLLKRPESVEPSLLVAFRSLVTPTGPAFGTGALSVTAWGLWLFLALSLTYMLATRWFDSIEAPGRSGRHSAWRSLPYRARRFYDVSVHWLLFVALAMALIGALPWLTNFVATRQFTDHHTWKALLKPIAQHKPMALGIAAVLVGVLGNLWGQRRTSQQADGRLATGLIVGASSIVLLLGVLLLAFLVTTQLDEQYSVWPTVVGALAILGSLGLMPEANYVSLHRYYRDRLMELFMPDLQRVRATAMTRSDDTSVGMTLPGDTTQLGDVCRGPTHQEPHRDAPNRERGPYHIINTNVVLVASQHPRYRGRGGDNFILSPLFCGSRATGWDETDRTPGRGFTLATAMAISGAAFNPNAGPAGDGLARQPVLSVLLGMLNLRLGYWANNPHHGTRSMLGSLLLPNLLWPAIGESFWRANLHERARLLLLTDGGHFENLGLYELVRRRLKLIVMCDATADPDCQFGDLANAIQKVRADFGAIVEGLDGGQLAALVPHPQDAMPEPAAKRGHLVARIRYALREGQTEHTADKGVLIVLKSTFFASASADLFGYRRQHPTFPNQSTSDQFFDERQFEAYRELGFQTAFTMLTDLQQAAERQQDAQTGQSPEKRAATLLWGAHTPTLSRTAAPNNDLRPMQW